MAESLKIEIPVTLEQIESVIIGAMEGGSNYWYFIDREQLENLPSGSKSLAEKIAKGLFNGGLEMPVYDYNEFTYHETWGTIKGEVLGTVTTESLKKAFSIAAVEHPKVFAEVMDNNADAGVSDIIFQLAVMGEVRFG